MNLLRYKNSYKQKNNLEAYPFPSDVLSGLKSYVSKTKKNKYVMLILDIVNLQSIAFSYGPKYLSSVLEESINKIQKVCGEETYAQILSQESFLFCFEYINEFEFEKNKVDIQAVFDTISFHAVDKPVFIKYKVGFNVFEKNDSVEEALSHSRIALFSAQRGNGKYCSYQDARSHMMHFDNQFKLANYFQRAIHENRLKQAFQPIIDSRTGKVKHYECLLRIVTEDGKIISAGPFIPIAEQLEFIDVIDISVLEMTIGELRMDKNIHLAMNVSNETIENPQWLSKAKLLLRDPDISSRLMVEITETSMHKDILVVAKFVEFIKSLGCKVAIDDFGAGYTSFTQLKLIQVDLIKIDGMFVRDIMSNYDSRLFVKTMLEFSKNFGIKSVAEFVETGEIAKILMDLQIDYMQGNYFGEAMNYRPWLKDGS